MCGIIACRSNVVEGQLEVIRRLISESQIRGRHATGVSFIHKDKLITIKESMNAKDFLAKHWLTISGHLLEEGSIDLIAHTRYSTSGGDIQPVADEETSVILNGVITQSSPDNWEDKFDVKCEGDNDAEIIFRLLEKGISPLTLDHSESDNHECSMAGVIMRKQGMLAFRNGKRPLYLTNHNDMQILASTKEIMRRAISPTQLCRKLDAGVLYNVGNTGINSIKSVKSEDWQDDY